MSAVGVCRTYLLRFDRRAHSNKPPSGCVVTHGNSVTETPAAKRAARPGVAGRGRRERPVFIIKQAPFT